MRHIRNALIWIFLALTFSVRSDAAFSVRAERPTVRVPASEWIPRERPTPATTVEPDRTWRNDGARSDFERKARSGNPEPPAADHKSYVAPGFTPPRYAADAEAARQNVLKREQQNEWAVLREALVSHDFDKLQVKESTVPGEYIVSVRGSQTRVVTLDDWAGVSGAIVFPAEYSLNTLAADAIAHSDPTTLQFADRLVLQIPPDLDVTAMQPVRIISYSKETGTLTIRPSEPLPSFRMQLKDDGAPSSFSSDARMREYIRTSTHLIRDGDEIPAFVKHQQENLALVEPEKEVERTVVALARRSPNRSLKEMATASSLGLEQFEQKPATILQSLPDPVWGPVGMLQLAWMKLNSSSGDDWRALRASLDFSQFGPQTKVIEATRAAILDEFQSGNNNVLVLMAHNKDGKLYLPGGGSIDIDDLRNMRRNETPNRAIILITCEAGGTGGPDPSFAEALLANQMARTVFASRTTVNGRGIPKVLEDMRTMPIRQALESLELEQIVALRGFNAKQII